MKPSRSLGAFCVYLSATLFLGVCSPLASAAVVYDEAIDGDLGGILELSTLHSFQLGSNAVTGTLWLRNQGTPSLPTIRNDIDAIEYILPANSSLDSIIIDIAQSSGSRFCSSCFFLNFEQSRT